MIRKRLIGMLLALALAAGMAGCGREDRAQPASDAPEEPSSLAVQSPEPEGPGEEWPQVDDALVREMVLTYGAKEADYNGTAVLTPELVSLYTYQENWSEPEEISAFKYYVWFFSTILKEDPDVRVERYKHPLGRENGWFFPQDIYEERVQKYFDVPVSHLREDKRVYDPELEGYWIGGGGGVGLDPFIDYAYTQDGDRVDIKVTMTYPDSPDGSGMLPFRARLSVRLTGDGGWKYQGMEYYSAEQLYPGEGSAWEELEGLTQEQRQLVERAEQIVRVFQVDTTGVLGDDWYGDLSGETRELGGMTYTRCPEDCYRNWEDFQADMLSVLTPEFFRRLNEIGTLERGIFTGEDGALYFVDMARGTSHTYLEDRTRYLLESGGDRISIKRYAYYCDSAAEGDDREPVSYRVCPIVLVNTAGGWRVEELVLPY